MQGLVILRSRATYVLALALDDFHEGILKLFAVVLDEGFWILCKDPDLWERCIWYNRISVERECPE